MKSWVGPGGTPLFEVEAGESADPCFDICSTGAQGGVVAAGTLLNHQYTIPLPGIWWIKFRLAFDDNGAVGAQTCIIQPQIIRNATGTGQEPVSILCNSSQSGCDTDELVCRIASGGRILFLNLESTAVGTTIYTLVQAKLISRT